MCVPRNPCGEMTAMTLHASGERGASYLGSMLFSRNVSGPRVVAPGTKATVEGVSFAGQPRSLAAELASRRTHSWLVGAERALPAGFGAHTAAFPCAYLTAACAVGMKHRSATCVRVTCVRASVSLAMFRRSCRRRHRAARSTCLWSVWTARWASSERSRQLVLVLPAQREQSPVQTSTTLLAPRRRAGHPHDLSRLFTFSNETLDLR